MPYYNFGPYVAYDPTTDTLVIDGVGQVYATTDTSFTTPLAIQGLDGDPLGDLRSSSIGVINEFQVLDHTKVLWKSGDYVLLITSFESVETSAAVAQQAAQDAAASAALSAQGAAPAGGATGQVLGKLSNTDFDTGWINGGGGGGGGTGSGVLVLSDIDDIPPGTPAGSLIARVSGAPAPTNVAFLNGAGNLTGGGDGSTDPLGLLTIPVPTSAAVGDVLFAVLGSQHSGLTDRAWGMPAGWTLEVYSTSGRKFGIATYPITDGAALSALGSEQTFTLANVQFTRVAGIIMRALNVDLVDPVIGVSTVSGTGTATTYSAPAFTSTESAGGLLTALVTNNATGTPGTTQPIPSQAGFDYIGSEWVDTNPTTNSNTAVHALARTAAGTAHPQVDGTLNPPAASGPVSVQIAIKKA